MKKKIFALLICLTVSLPAVSYSISEEEYTTFINGFFTGFEKGLIKNGLTEADAAQYTQELRSRFNRQEFVNQTKDCIEEANTENEFKQCFAPALLEFMAKNSDLRGKYVKQ